MEDEMREQLERALHSREPQIRQHLEAGYARKVENVKADAEGERERESRIELNTKCSKHT
eukprot:2869230-Amphidinium_carterae.1